MNQAWMITFADLVSLMLTFFVMLFAMSSVQVDKWESMVDAISRSMNPAKETTSDAPPTAKYNVGSVYRRRAINLDYLQGVLQDVIQEDPRMAGTYINLLDDRVVISLPGGRMFAPGKAILLGNAKHGVDTLGGVLRNLTNQIGVMGHTGVDSPGGSYQSNWELSIARAAAVANGLKSAGYQNDVLVFGLADTRYEDLASLPKAQRDVLAQRVDVFVLPSKTGL